MKINKERMSIAVIHVVGCQMNGISCDLMVSAYLRLVAGRSPGDIAYTILPLHLATVGHLHLQA